MGFWISGLENLLWCSLTRHVENRVSSLLLLCVAHRCSQLVNCFSALTGVVVLGGDRTTVVIDLESTNDGGLSQRRSQVPGRNCYLQGGKLGPHQTDLLTFHWSSDMLLQKEAASELGG